MLKFLIPPKELFYAVNARDKWWVLRLGKRSFRLYVVWLWNPEIARIPYLHFLVLAMKKGEQEKQWTLWSADPYEAESKRA